jgi:hypothetical protein
MALPNGALNLKGQIKDIFGIFHPLLIFEELLRAIVKIIRQYLARRIDLFFIE